MGQPPASRRGAQWARGHDRPWYRPGSGSCDGRRPAPGAVAGVAFRGCAGRLARRGRSPGPPARAPRGPGAEPVLSAPDERGAVSRDAGLARRGPAGALTRRRAGEGRAEALGALARSPPGAASCSGTRGEARAPPAGRPRRCEGRLSPAASTAAASALRVAASGGGHLMKLISGQFRPGLTNSCMSGGVSLEGENDRV